MSQSTVNSVRRTAGRKKMRQDRSAPCRENQRLKIALKKESTKAERYRKRCWREKLKIADAGTPRSKTKKQLANCNVGKNVRKTLLFHNIFFQDFRDKFTCSKSDKYKQYMSKILPSNILNKYHLLRFVQERFDVSHKRLRKNNCCDTPLVYSRKSYASLAMRLRSSIVSFLERDDNSRITTSKRDVVSKEKKQRRLLCESMLYL